MYKRFIANFMETRSLTLRAQNPVRCSRRDRHAVLALNSAAVVAKAILIRLTVFERSW